MTFDSLSKLEANRGKFPYPLSLFSLQEEIAPVNLTDAETFRIFQQRQELLIRWGVYFLGRSETAQRGDRVIETNRLFHEPFDRVFNPVFPHNRSKLHRFSNNGRHTRWNDMFHEFFDPISIAHGVGMTFDQAWEKDHTVCVNDRSLPIPSERFFSGPT